MSRAGRAPGGGGCGGTMNVFISIPYNNWVFATEVLGGVALY
jgi:hypothetical protein